MDRFDSDGFLHSLVSVILVTLLVSGCATDSTTTAPPPERGEYDLNTPDKAAIDLERAQRQWLEESGKKSRLNRHR